mmetsp:Transcript_25243/g.82903  ORF Transcript_25243/g.82903 Transcript_25243/m.82903 type:complete len:430 (-) Transcript_25243:103-1392(-)
MASGPRQRTAQSVGWLTVGWCLRRAPASFDTGSFAARFQTRMLLSPHATATLYGSSAEVASAYGKPPMPLTAQLRLNDATSHKDKERSIAVVSRCDEGSPLKGAPQGWMVKMARPGAPVCMTRFNAGSRVASLFPLITTSHRNRSPPIPEIASKAFVFSSDDGGGDDDKDDFSAGEEGKEEEVVDESPPAQVVATHTRPRCASVTLPPGFGRFSSIRNLPRSPSQAMTCTSLSFPPVASSAVPSGASAGSHERDCTSPAWPRTRVTSSGAGSDDDEPTVSGSRMLTTPPASPAARTHRPLTRGPNARAITAPLPSLSVRTGRSPVEPPNLQSSSDPDLSPLAASPATSQDTATEHSSLVCALIALSGLRAVVSQRRSEPSVAPDKSKCAKPCCLKKPTAVTRQLCPARRPRKLACTGSNTTMPLRAAYA